MTKYDIPMMASSGYVAEIDSSLCTSCGACVDACPFDALSVVKGKSTMNWDMCMGCGVCTSKCPEGAISLIRDEKKGIPLDVRLLAENRADRQ